MNRGELLACADTWQVKLKKKYQNSKQILKIIEPYWLEDPDVSSAILFGIISFQKGINIKPHAKLQDNGSLKDGHISAPRTSRRRGNRDSISKPFDRAR